MSKLKDLDPLLESNPRILWVCAHPDDEFLSGSILVRASVHYECPVHIVIMTRGEGGAVGNYDPELLAETRREEMRAVAADMGATVEFYSFYNAPLPVESFPTRQELYAKWLESDDPVKIVSGAIKRFQPDIVLTFDPDNGATGHPEHTLTARVTTNALQQCAHKPKHSFFVQKRHWIFRLFRDADPGPSTHVFDGRKPATWEKNCIDYLCDLTKLHTSQDRDLAPFRRFRRLFEVTHLREIDPQTESWSLTD